MLPKSSALFSGLSILQTYDSDEDEAEEPVPSPKTDGEYLSSPPEPEPSSAGANPSVLEPHPKRQRVEGISEKRMHIITNDDSSNESRNIQPESGVLSVPKNILEMFSGNGHEEQFDDSSLHLGRKRSFPHVRGNWASFIYLPCSYSANDEDHVFWKLQSLVDDASASFKGTHVIHSVEDKHITLSRTLSFRHHWIESFASNLKRAISIFPREQLILEGFTVYTNDEKTRTFISMKVSTTESLLRLVKICDECLAEYDLPPYYEDPSFHISCAWMLGNTKKWAKATLLPYLNKKWEQLVQSEADMRLYTVDLVEFKTGNQLFRFPFSCRKNV